LPLSKQKVLSVMRSYTRENTAYIFGNEITGIEKEVLNEADYHIQIPLSGLKNLSMFLYAQELSSFISGTTNVANFLTKTSRFFFQHITSVEVFSWTTPHSMVKGKVREWKDIYLPYTPSPKSADISCCTTFASLHGVFVLWGPMM